MPEGKKPKQLRGVQFPPGADGNRNSTDAVKGALRASTGSADAGAAAKLDAERNWRYGYNVHLVKNCELLARGPESEAAAIAVAGLLELHGGFEFVDASGSSKPLAAAMASVPELVGNAGGFDCGVVVGRLAETPPGPLRVPYSGQLLEGGALRKQLQKWLDNGIIERDALTALGQLSDSTAVDLKGHTFVCLGAGSEMGPTRTLLAHGATVLAVDVGKHHVWQQLVQAATESRGTLLLPLRRLSGSAAMSAPSKRLVGDGIDMADLCSNAGCNILEETPSIAAWILANSGSGPLCVGSYVYMDGANFVRVALAADAVIDAVCKARPDVALACLSSPTECYAVPREAWDRVTERLKAPPAGRVHLLWYEPLRRVSKGKYCVPATPAASVETPSGPVLLRDSYTHMQGPNYAFAKQIQRWRMLLARSRGHIASSNVGPMTLTRSILSNKLIGAGVKGAVHFGLEPFYAETSRALLAMLLIHDLKSQTSAANPSVELGSPLQLFSENALHVGSWNAAFSTNSFTEVCALTFAAGKAQPYVATGLASLAGLGAWQLRSKL